MSSNAVNAAMPMRSVLSACRDEVSTPLPSTTLTSASCARHVLYLGSRRKLQQEGRNPIELKVSRADVGVGMAHAVDRGRVVGLRRRRWLGGGARVRGAAERNDVGERGEAQKIGLVERPDAGFAEPGGHAHGHPANVERFAESGG